MRRVLAALALASLLLGGCQTLPRVPYALETLHAASPDYRYNFIEPGTRVRFLGDIGGVGREHPSGELQLLPLSGGGANGAYGAGVMYGWGRRGDRPEFDVVTGVSAGALIAPFVFAGSAFDPALREAFTDGRAKNLLRSRGLGALLWPGVFKPEPLRKLITNSVTPGLVEAVGAEHRKGRRLYIATTSLDTQTQVVWDMGALAQRTDPESRQLFQNILIASSSIPGVFPPVLLTFERGGQAVSELHADGGTVANFFAAGFARRPDAHHAGGARLHPPQQSDHAAVCRRSGGRPQNHSAKLRHHAEIPHSLRAHQREACRKRQGPEAGGG